MPSEDEDKPDFSFKSVEKEVDKLFSDKEEKKEKIAEIPHLSDKIKQGMEIKNNLPDKDFLRVDFKEANVTFKDKDGNKKTEKKLVVNYKDVKGVDHVEITNGIYKLDLRDDAYFWFIRTPEVIPQRMQQISRASIDRKKCYEPEKRKLDLPVLLIVGLAVGAIIIVVSFISFMT